MFFLFSVVTATKSKTSDLSHILSGSYRAFVAIRRAHLPLLSHGKRHYIQLNHPWDQEHHFSVSYQFHCSFNARHNSAREDQSLFFASPRYRLLYHHPITTLLLSFIIMKSLSRATATAVAIYGEFRGGRHGHHFVMSGRASCVCTSEFWRAT